MMEINKRKECRQMDNHKISDLKLFVDDKEHKINSEASEMSDH